MGRLRAQAITEPILQDLDFPGDLSLEIDKYLKVHVSEIENQESRNIVIAGCLMAGDFYSNPEDLVSVVPMQLSRARKRAASRMEQPRTSRIMKTNVRRKDGRGKTRE